MDLPEHSGVIPDHFFYIGELPVVGKRRIDWSTDPPPDLAIECDVTSFTSVNDYLPYRVSRPLAKVDFRPPSPPILGGT